MTPTRRLLASTLALASWGCTQSLTSDTNNIEIRRLNTALAAKAQALNLTYLDTYSIMLAQDGRPVVFFYQPDGEHLSEVGYLHWVDTTLAPLIKARGFKHVSMVGDSITRRVGSVTLPSGAPATWADVLGIPAENEGVDGETSLDVLARVDTLPHAGVDCYYVMVGNNDLHAGRKVDDIIDTVEILVTTLKARTGKPVVIQAVMPLLPQP